MFKKPLTIAAIALTAGATLLPTAASAGDPGVGALVGGVFGAAIGHNVNGRDGAVVGGVLGALTGASIAANSGRHYYDSGYAGSGYVGSGYVGSGYAGPAHSYYPRTTVYYSPPPVYVRTGYGYYSPPVVYYRPRPSHVHYVAPRYSGRDHVNRYGHNEWRDGRDHRGSDGYDRRGR